MKQFEIKSYHDVNLDSYDNGEGKYINGYTLSRRVKTDDIKKSIENYFINELYYRFNFDDAFIDENGLHFDVLVDSENIEILPDTKEYKQWKNGERILYNNHILLQVEELVKLDIDAL